MLRLPYQDLRQGELQLSPEAARYVARVHRLGVGARLLLFDPSACLEADARVVASGRAGARVLCGPPRPASVRPSRSVTVVQALAKGHKLDAIVRDATELGATRFVPAVAERSVKRGGAQLLGRLRRVALEAARQCGRGDMPELVPPLSLGDALRLAAPPAAGLGLCLHPGAEIAAGRLLQDLRPHDAPVSLALGPEGGFSATELAQARDLGFHVVSLGRLVLRTETACAAALGALLVLER